MEDDAALLDWLETLDRSYESKLPHGHNFLDQIQACASTVERTKESKDTAVK